MGLRACGSGWSPCTRPMCTESDLRCCLCLSRGNPTPRSTSSDFGTAGRASTYDRWCPGNKHIHFAQCARGAGVPPEVREPRSAAGPPHLQPEAAATAALRSSRRSFPSVCTTDVFVHQWRACVEPSCRTRRGAGARVSSRGGVSVFLVLDPCLSKGRRPAS